MLCKVYLVCYLCNMKQFQKKYQDRRDGLYIMYDFTLTLIHQDVNAQGHIIVERTDDSLVFMNQGMMLVSRQQYFEGGRSICRNPILQKMFMMLGRAEKAGSGVDKIVSGWKYLGWPLPTVAEETRPDYVVLTMQLGTEPDKKTRQENPTRKPRKKVQ